MKTTLLLSVILYHSFSCSAQVYNRKVIHSNDNLSDYFTYRFPSFEEATVLLKNGGSLKSRMNFNTLLCNMQFIGSKGDTLEISKPADIDSIQLNNCTFFFRKGYFEIVDRHDSVILAVSRKISLEPLKIGAMGLPSHSGGIESVESYTSNAKYVKALQLSLDQDIDILEKTEYFLIIDTDKMIKANKSNFLKIFNGDNKRIEIFLKANKINFNDQNDLRKLFDFCIHS